MGYTIGIDIGGTKIAGVLVTEKGKIQKCTILPTEANKGRKRIVENIIKVINYLDNGKIQKIGIGTPGFIDKKNKLVLIKNIPSLTGFDLANTLKNKTGKKVSIHNDAKCFAVAEHRLGAGKGYKNMVGFIIGTGIGAGIIINNQLYEGTSYGASEIGHTIISDKSDKCSCGNHGDLESLCSGPNIVKRHNSIKGIKRMKSPKDIFSSRDIKTKKFVDETLDYLAKGIANIVNILDPGIIVIGGGLSHLPIFKEINKRFKKYTNANSAKSNIIEKNHLGDYSGAIGAALLSFNH